MKKFMRTREPAHPHPQPPHHLNGYTNSSKTNGHANGGGVGARAGREWRDESRSTLSSRGLYWSGPGPDSEAGGGGGGGCTGALWEDAAFPPERALHKRHAKNVLWMRPY